MKLRGMSCFFLLAVFLALSAIAPAALPPQAFEKVDFKSSPAIQAADQHSATITWETSINSSTGVIWGTDPNRLDKRGGAPFGIRHEVRLENLQPGTNYYFKAMSGNNESCGVRTFATAQAGQPAVKPHVATFAISCEEEGKAHFVDSPRIQAADQHSATIEWNTNLRSSTRVIWGVDPKRLDKEGGAPFGTEHQVRLENLQPGTTYYFKALSGQDESCGVRSFTTTKPGDPAFKVHIAPIAVPCGH